MDYFFGIRSERQLVCDIQVNVAYRWFLGFGLQDKIPHSSTISQNRRRRFNGSDVFREMFDDVVLLALRNGFVDGKTLYTDSTHLKANANKHKYKRKRQFHTIQRSTLRWKNQSPRIAKNKQSLSKKPEESEMYKEIKRSKTV